MHMDGAHLQAIVGVLSVHGGLRKLPRAMNVVGAQMQNDFLAVVGVRLHAIRSQLAASFILSREGQTAKGRCA